MSDWNLVPLKNVATFIRGINFKPHDVVPIGTAGAVACMRTKNVQEKLELSDVWAVSKEFVKRENQILKNGDILISSANSWNLVGKCCWVFDLPWESSFGGFITALRCDPNKIYPRYLYRWFSSGRIQNLVRSFGRQTTNISNLDINRCLELPVPLPPIAEQKRIAAILDKAEELRELRRQALRELDAIAQSIFIEMFGSMNHDHEETKNVPLSEVTTKITDGTHLTPKFIDRGIPFIFVKNIKNGSIDFQTDKFISKQEHENLYKRCPVEKGDILYTTVGATYGQAAAVGSFTQFAFQRHIAHLKPDKNKVITQYLETVMQLPLVKNQADHWVRGAAQPTINLKELREFLIPLPSLHSQQEFTRRLESIEQLKTTHRESLAQLDALFTSLQNRAFRGEL